jgi:hypothetical protein
LSRKAASAPPRSGNPLVQCLNNGFTILCGHHSRESHEWSQGQAGIRIQRPRIPACPASFGRGQHGMTKHVKALRRHYTNIYLDNHPPFVLHNSYEYESFLQRAELLFLVLVRQGYAPRGLLTPKLGQTGHGCITHGPFYFEGHDNHGPFCLPRKGE